MLEVDDTLPPKVLMARVLGLSKCDYQEAPFVRFGRAFSPTRRHLFDEVRHRFKILGMDSTRSDRSLLPADNSSKSDFVSWLIDNPIPHDHLEASRLRPKLTASDQSCNEEMLVMTKIRK